MIVDLGTSALGQRTVLIDVGVRQSLRPVAAQVGPPVAVRVAAVVDLAPRGGWARDSDSRCTCRDHLPLRMVGGCSYSNSHGALRIVYS